ncbi:MAG: radical SAM protein [Myxococcales bacterium]|nr:radical SAM protein [Myxococcales bacterium]
MGERAAWHESGAVLLHSAYELGRQPFNIASPWAQLEAAGFGVDGVDTSVTELTDEVIARARLVAISVPMHTALRLGVEIAQRVRRVASDCHIAMFGLYAALNARHLLTHHVDSVIGGEFEVALVALARRLSGVPAVDGVEGMDGNAASREDEAEAPARITGLVSSIAELDGGLIAPSVMRKLPFVVPRRDRLAPLDRYATFFGPGPHEIRKVGYVEASRGCLHKCRHCPITPVYEGRFFVVPREIVLADAEQQVAMGAEHLTFGDPDFFNGPKHGMSILEALHARHPRVSFDVTIKIEHLLSERHRVADLARLGCAFVLSAVESLSDTVLMRLDKGHSRADVATALAICRGAGLALRPSLMPFTPFSTLADYLELCEWVASEGLVDAVDAVQLSIRLLIPPGSALLDGDEDRPWLGELVAENFGYAWTHSDPRMDQLSQAVAHHVEANSDCDPAILFLGIRELAYRAAALTPPPITLARTFVPRLSESWFCCAEPTTRQLGNVANVTAS